MRPILALTDTLISTVAGGSPPVRALTLAYAKLAIRALGTTDDELIGVWIDAAASYFEQQTGRQLLTATREVWLDAFPVVGSPWYEQRIELPRPPLQSVVSITYLDGSGVLRSFTDGASPATNFFTVSKPVGPYAARGFVEPIAGKTWPIAGSVTGAVRIRYTCGYGNTAADVPPLARGVLSSLVGHFDTYRTPVAVGAVIDLPYGLQSILDMFRWSALPSQTLRGPAVWPLP
jgi:uncharacterized phiE125 gp8 family phage protein